jgi:hypothetical protein
LLMRKTEGTSNNRYVATQAGLLFPGRSINT